jgi:pimeloyl-[acyl-carrier protein] methyl ester esterase
VNDLLLIHGWGFNREVWLPVSQYLGADWRVSLVNLPGYGVPVLTGRDLPSNATVCGWSLGGMQAMEWAMAYPDKVARLVLVGATPRFVEAPDWPHGQPADLLDRFGRDVAADPTAALRRFAALINRGDRLARPLTRGLCTLLGRSAPDTAILETGLSTLRHTDLRDRVAKIRQPVLIVHGQHDPLIPPVTGRWLAQNLPNGRLQLVTDSAHAPFLSQPAHFARLLADFAHV